MHDPALADKYKRGIHPRNLAGAQPHLLPSGVQHRVSFILLSQSRNCKVMTKPLKLCLEETATQPARVDDLDSLELAYIMELSEKFRGGLTPSAAVTACA
jgi:hypothetical protein